MRPHLTPHNMYRGLFIENIRQCFTRLFALVRKRMFDYNNLVCIARRCLYRVVVSYHPLPDTVGAVSGSTPFSLDFFNKSLSYSTIYCKENIYYQGLSIKSTYPSNRHPRQISGCPCDLQIIPTGQRIHI